MLQLFHEKEVKPVLSMLKILKPLFYQIENQNNPNLH
jgi:hypothetical protein